MPIPAQFNINTKNYEILRDIKMDENYYACTIKENEKRNEIVGQYDFQITNVPDEYIITVIPLVYTGQMEANRHIYILNEGISLEFQINRLTSVATIIVE